MKRRFSFAVSVCAASSMGNKIGKSIFLLPLKAKASSTLPNRSERRLCRS